MCICTRIGFVKYPIGMMLMPLISVGMTNGCRNATPRPDRPTNQRVTRVILNGNIWTGNVDQPRAQAMAIAGDRIYAVGSNDAVRAQADAETEIVDASGAFIVPGLIDSHTHFLIGGFRLASVQLRDAHTPEIFIERIQAFAKTVEPGTWIMGGDWDHENWGGELPTHQWIDAVTPNNPVFINRLDGHMALANSLTLAAAGIDSATPEVDGGEIVRFDNGRPSGILKDNAMNLAYQVMPPATDDMKRRALLAAMDYVAARGVTSVHNMGTWDELDAFEKAHQDNALTTRIYAAVPLASWEHLRDKVSREGEGDDWLKIGALKSFSDGSLGSHTAAFFEPYTDQPEDLGLLINEETDLYQWTKDADRAGLHVMVHAIGDRANQLMLDTFEQIIAENGPRDRRFRIEHAQHLTETDIGRFAELNVIPSMQPYHAIDDGRWAERLIGPHRAQTTYAIRALLDHGAKPALGSDWFVAPPTPLAGIYAAVTRRTLDDRHPNGWIPEQKITVEEALRGYTIDAAYASFEEDRKGSLETGKLADYVVLDSDLTAMDPVDIRHVTVLETVVGGRTVYRHQ